MIINIIIELLKVFYTKIQNKVQQLLLIATLLIISIIESVSWIILTKQINLAKNLGDNPRLTTRSECSRQTENSKSSKQSVVPLELVEMLQSASMKARAVLWISQVWWWKQVALATPNSNKDSSILKWPRVQSLNLKCQNHLVTNSYTLACVETISALSSTFGSSSSTIQICRTKQARSLISNSLLSTAAQSV